ncbi:metalloregulator ArsR/SmtB family transcription factor [Hyphomonas sp.]|uniref:ArsR/SmtB family transcription factor n=1 Tax=Hyphomonas sp. TaxID=87 RepID=UPI000AA3D59F|nr:metalloregulator ArsR/SmtB family transcription factor [Hyphomonas sp.]MBA4337714.1 ArsR family transcriptional regulator [Hyphomonas sp.]
MRQTTFDPALFRERAGEAAKLLRTMSNEHRLMILCRLEGGEVSAGDLLAGTTLSQSALSQHLAVLREDGLVATRRAGLNIYYRIADPSALRVIATLAEIFCPEE